MLTATNDEKLADPFLPELYRIVRTTPEIPDVVTIDIAPVPVCDRLSRLASSTCSTSSLTAMYPSSSAMPLPMRNSEAGATPIAATTKSPYSK